jgi:hypothetical protein
MGGIDEIGIFVIPAVLAIYVLRRAERQARKRAAEEAAAAGEVGVPADESANSADSPL